jgi:WD40 repeat protein
MSENLESPSLTPSPYVGPRPFKSGEVLFGRDRERDELLYLLIAERIVLLYSPSGAGKTSLVEAALVPALEERGFRVLPRVRAGQALPPGVPTGANRFLYTTLATLEQQQPQERRLSPEQLVAADLTTYLLALAGAVEQAAAASIEPEPVLIFDQFEEVLTADATDLAAKREFFRQLGQALENRRLWALFVLREDFLAALDPFLDPIPNRFRDHFRLTLLSPDAARAAIEEPVKAHGVEFEEQAIVQLVDDLGLAMEIEPVQLQVVCLRLWQNLAPQLPSRQKPLITVSDIEKLGDVNQALTEYYAEWVTKAAAAGAGEHAIRLWFTKELLTRDGWRNKVIGGTHSSGSLSNAVINVLVDAHLVRAERSRNMVWYELTHDRLIEPIKSEYQLWSQDHLSRLQSAAIVWAEQNRPPNLLLRGGELRRARTWYDANQEQATAIDREFLAASDAEQSRRRVFGAIMVALVLVALAAVVATLRSQQNARVADVLQTAALALEGREVAPQRSILLALLAREQAQETFWPLQGIGRNNADPSLVLAEETLRQTLASVGGLPLRGHMQQLQDVTFSPDGRWVATASIDGTVRLWALDAVQQQVMVLRSHTQEVLSVAFSPDSQLLATAGDDNTIRVWRVDMPQQPPVVLRGHIRAVYGIAFSTDGRWLASSSEDDTVRLWSMDPLDGSSRLIGVYPNAGRAQLRALDIGPDNTLAVGFENGALLWNLDQLGTPPQTLSGHVGAVTAVKFSNDGRTVATASAGGTLLFWRLESPPVRIVLTAQGNPINSLAFNADGLMLAAGGFDDDVQRWKLSPVVPDVDQLPGHGTGTYALAFNPRNNSLAVGGIDGVVHVWPSDTSTAVVLRGHGDSISQIEYSPDGKWLATASWDGLARLWRSDTPEATPLVLRQPTVEGLGGGIPTVLFGTDSRRLVTLFNNGAVQIWAIDAPQLSPIALPGRSVEVSALALSPGGNQLAIGGADGLVQLQEVNWPTPHPRTLWQHNNAGNYGRVAALAFSPDGRWLASGSWDGTLRFGQVGQGTPLTLEAGDLVRTLAFSADSSRIAAGGNDGVVRVWRVGLTPGEPELLMGHTRPVSVVAFSGDGRWLASGGDDRVVRLWRLGASEPAIELRGHEQQVEKLVFSPDGRWLATGGNEGSVRLWSLDRPNDEARVLRGHSAAIRALAFSTGGAFVASASADGVAQFWRIEAFEAGPVRLLGHTAEVVSLAFSPDEHLLATASVDGTTRVWQVESEALIEAACQIVGRNFTLAEWEQFVGPRQSYRRVCSNLPSDASVYQAMISNGEIATALRLYQDESGLGLRTESPASWLVLTASSLLPTEDKEAREHAVAALRQALVLDPRLETPSVLALARFCEHGADQSYAADILPACDAAVTFDPQQGIHYYYRAGIHELLDRRAEAAEDLCTFLELAINNPDAASKREDAQQRRAALVPGAPPCPTQ